MENNSINYIHLNETSQEEDNNSQELSESHNQPENEIITQEIITDDIENSVGNNNLQICKICYEMKPLRLLFCGHEMCLDCVQNVKYIKGKKTCPFCRETYLSKRISEMVRTREVNQRNRDVLCIIKKTDCKNLTFLIIFLFFLCSFLYYKFNI